MFQDKITKEERLRVKRQDKLSNIALAIFAGLLFAIIVFVAVYQLDRWALSTCEIYNDCTEVYNTLK